MIEPAVVEIPPEALYWGITCLGVGLLTFVIKLILIASNISPNYIGEYSEKKIVDNDKDKNNNNRSGFIGAIIGVIINRVKKIREKLFGNKFRQLIMANLKKDLRQLVHGGLGIIKVGSGNFQKGIFFNVPPPIESCFSVKKKIV